MTRDFVGAFTPGEADAENLLGADLTVVFVPEVSGRLHL